MKLLLVPKAQRALTALLLLSSLAPAPHAQDAVRPPTPTPTPTVVRAGLVHTTLLRVEVEVVDGVANTRLVQTIRNDTNRPQAEAIWILPLPEGAVADDFRMTANGVELAGEVLGADQAREVYESIVRRQRDPGLLEYVGRGCLRARVFPIPAGGAVEVEVGFRHVLPRVGGVSRWSLPVAAAGVGGKAPAQVVLDLALRSKRPIKNAFSPTPGVEVVQSDDHAVRASFEGTGAVPDELAVLYGLSDADFGVNLVTHHEQGEAEGTFLMLLSPKRDWADEVVVEKEITFVLDTSGSMAGDKIRQARASLRFFLSSLRPGDRFNVVPFSTEARPFFGAPVEASPENLAAALARVDQVEAVGGTNIADALAAGLRRAEDDGGAHVPMVVFLTDGLPTVGTTAPKEILGGVRAANVGGTRIFVLGVGHDVNTDLLDTLAAETRGTRDYVRPDEDVEVASGALFTKLAHPVLTDLELTVDDVRLTRTVPQQLGDLFQGERIELYGRYEGKGPHAIRLTGTMRGARHTYVFEGTFAEPGPSSFGFVAALWAQRRVGLLLDELRRNGANQELIGEITRLGRTYGIVTPYTSNLIVEDGMQVAAGEPRGGVDLEALQALGYAGGGAGGAPNSPRRSLNYPASSDGFSLGRAPVERELDLEQVALLLAKQEVLAPDADPGAYRALAGQVVLRFEDARTELSLLQSNAATGAQAVERSVYLRDLVTQGGRGDVSALVELFTRHVGTRRFHLRRGVWTDSGYDATSTLPRRTVEAFSAEYFALLRERPELRSFLALGERVLVVLDDLIVEVTAAATVEDPAGN